MGKYKEDKYDDKVDVVIPLSTLDAAICHLMKCESSETQHVMGCFVEWKIKKYFDNCLKNSKKKVERKEDCEFSTTYNVIGYEE